jgi:hypothetical protein
MWAILPIEVVWASSVLLCIGGGHKIFNSMIYTLVSDALEADQRSTQLYFMNLGPHLARLTTPRIATALMESSLYAPFWVSGALSITIIIITPFIQEAETPLQLEPSENSSLLASTNENDPTDARPEDAADINPQDQERWYSNLFTQATQIPSIFPNRPAKFCVLVIFLKRIGFASEGFAFQYTSAKFGWQLRETTWLRVAAAVGAILIVMIAPLTTQILVRRGMNTHTVDLNFMRFALVTLSVSFFGAYRASSGMMMGVGMPIFCFPWLLFGGKREESGCMLMLDSNVWRWTGRVFGTGYPGTHHLCDERC